MTSREAFEAHIKSMIESEAGEAQALARRPDDDYITEWVRHQWWGWQTAIQHARDVGEDCIEHELGETGQAKAIVHAIKEALK